MRAYLVENNAGPFTPVDLPRPVPSEGEALVRIHARSVNPLDTKIRAGKAEHSQTAVPRGSGC